VSPGGFQAWYWRQIIWVKRIDLETYAHLDGSMLIVRVPHSFCFLFYPA
jgi:hypothetical protein